MRGLAKGSRAHRQGRTREWRAGRAGGGLISVAFTSSAHSSVHPPALEVPRVAVQAHAEGPHPQAVKGRPHPNGRVSAAPHSSSELARSATPLGQRIHPQRDTAVCGTRRPVSTPTWTWCGPSPGWSPHRHQRLRGRRRRCRRPRRRCRRTLPRRRQRVRPWEAAGQRRRSVW